MANYINTETYEYPFTEQDIRNQNPNTSFPSPFIAPEGYALVFSSPQPEYDSIIQIVREVQPELTVKDVYEQRWEVISKFVEYTDESGVLHTVAEQEEIAIAENQRVQNEQFQKFIVAETQKKLDVFAATRGYDDVNSAAKYKDISDEEIRMLPEDEQPLVTKFRTECRYLSISVARTWAKLYLILAEVQAGTREKPESFAEIEAELPELSWPI